MGVLVLCHMKHQCNAGDAMREHKPRGKRSR
jgi:hypothetical protein